MTSSLYKNYIENKCWANENFGQFSALDDLYFRAELARTGFSLSKGTCILEIGFGNGVFAGWANYNNINYIGVELIDDLLIRGRKAGFQVYDAKSDFVIEIGEKIIDLVVAFDVFEHFELDALIEMLIKLKICLRQGGGIIARVPSGDSPFGRAIYYGDLTHKLILGSSAVRQLAEMCEYDVVDICPPQLPLKVGNWKRFLKRLSILTFQKIVARIINLVFHENKSRVITPNLIFFLRKSGF